MAAASQAVTTRGISHLQMLQARNRYIREQLQLISTLRVFRSQLFRLPRIASRTFQTRRSQRVPMKPNALCACGPARANSSLRTNARARCSRGLDKFFNLLTDWTLYLNPLATRLLPVTPQTFMHVVGIVEIAAGPIVLSRLTRLGAYVVALWLAVIALNLLVMGKFLDVAVRDVGLAVAAFTLSQLTAVREEASGIRPIPAAQGLAVRP